MLSLRNLNWTSYVEHHKIKLNNSRNLKIKYSCHESSKLYREFQKHNNDIYKNFCAYPDYFIKFPKLNKVLHNLSCVEVFKLQDGNLIESQSSDIQRDLKKEN